MRSRSESAPAPDPIEYPWFAVDVPGKGVHHFKGMSPIKNMRFVRELTGGTGKIDAAADPLGAAVEQWAYFGAAIGRCWAHESLALESAESDYSTLLEYGEAVSDELHAAGYSPQDQNALALPVLAGMGGMKTGAKEVADRADFSAAPEAGTA
jgi:hypothetical protein